MPTLNPALWDGTLPPQGPQGPQGPAGAPRLGDLGWSGVTLVNAGSFPYANAWVRTVSAQNAIQIIGITGVSPPLLTRNTIEFINLPAAYRTYYANTQFQLCRAWTSGGTPVAATVQLSLGNRVWLCNYTPYDLIEFRLSTVTFSIYDVYA